MSGSASDGELPRVAFQGEAGAFSEEALVAHFGGGVEPLPCRDFDGVGSRVRSGEAGYGVLPVENSLAGSVQGAYDVLAAGGLTIVGEIILPIRHFLLGCTGARLEQIRRVTSHPVALAQCVRFLSGRPEIEVVAVYDTAGAAREVARGGDPAVAAVASRGAGDRYGLEVLAADIQDRDDNQTRFFVVRPAGDGAVGQEPAPGSAAPSADMPPGSEPVLAPAPAGRASPSAGEVEKPRWKSVLLIELEDRPGALLRVLEPFAERKISLSKLESRPAEVPWRYRFILELRAHLGDPAAKDAVAEVRRRSDSLAVLGSFAAAR